MKSLSKCSLLLLVGLSMLPSCTAKYQQMLLERDRKIKELYAQVTDLTSTNQELDSRERGARARLQTLEERLAARKSDGPSDLARLKAELPGVDVQVSGNRLSLGINNTVTFSSGSVALKKSASSVLRNVARVLKRDYAGRRIVVEGHTDSDPIRRTKGRFRNNRHLSVERADAVANFLITNCNVNEASVVVAGYGPHAPKSKSKESNRRVEIVVGEVQ